MAFTLIVRHRLFGLVTASCFGFFSRFWVGAFSAPRSTTDMKSPSLFFYGILILWSIVLVFVGCATLQPGADPLVVRAQQLETTADASFQLVVSVDNSDRGFWRTNAPAFHNFAEWLRTPVPTASNPNEPRGLGMILLVDADVLAYRANKSQSNILISAISDLSLVAAQAQAWSAIVSAKTP